MNIKKRNGRLEALKLDKIVKRIEKQCYGLDLKFVDFNQVAITVFNGLYDGATVQEIDELIAEASASLSTHHPDYSILASRIVVSALHKETSKSFSTSMKKLYEEGILDKEFYECVQRNKNVLDGSIIQDRDFNYDYFGIRTLLTSYLLKDSKQVVVERPQYMLMRVCVALWKGDMKEVLNSYEMMSNGLFTHATPTLFNAGTIRQQLSSCFLLTMDDSVVDIYKILGDCAKISQLAGGIGLNVSNIRATGSRIKGTNGISDGIVPMLRVFNDTATYINQGGGKRKGSFAVYLEPWHADVFDFLDLKKTHGKEERRARDLFYAIWNNDVFMKQVQLDSDWYLMCPNECKGLIDSFGDDFEKLYWSYVESGTYRKKIKARDLYSKIIESQMETGTPYILHKDAINKKSNQKNLGTIKSSNLCVAPETKILTDKGHITIGEHEGEYVKVWNGESWSSTKIVKTNEDVEVMTIKFSDGSSLDCTPYHKFYDWKGNTVRALDLFEGFSLEPYQLEDGVCIKLHVASIERTGRICDTYCVNEPVYNKVIFNGVLTGNCAEIVQYTSADEQSVCNLLSIALPKYIKDGKYDFNHLHDVAYQGMKNLNQVIDINYYPTPETKNSNTRHRPVAMGVQGLADVFAILNIPFDSDEAKLLNKQIFETIYHGATQASCDIAKIDGAYSSFEGSPISQGIFQFDMWETVDVTNGTDGMQASNNRPVELSGLWDWESLREDVMKFGVRNSLSTSVLPTASTSQILGNNECTEPYTSNIYSRRTLHGNFTLVNKHLIKDLIKLGLWDDNMRKLIIKNEGSVQNISSIPQKIKDIYKTVWEIKQRDLIDMSADRGAFIDQTQSLNIFFDNINSAKVSSALMYGWLKGLKTGVYYTRQQTKSSANVNLGIDLSNVVEQRYDTEDVVACSLDNPDACMACSA